MALGASFNVIVLVLASSWISEPIYGQSCSVYPQDIDATTGFSTTITSPGYPSNYGYNLECNWRIQAGSFLSDYIVKVTFNDFQVGGGSLGICFSEKLEFYDGDSTLSNLLGSYCGTVNPEVIYSSGHYLYIKFSSGYGSSYKGFSLNVAAVAKEEAAGICRNGGSGNDVMQLSGPSGTIFSPDYPYPYPRDTKCTWVVSVPAGKRVKLTFKDFDLGIGFTQCNYHTGDEDYVAIRDGEYSWSDELVRYCDYNYNMKSVRDVYSTGNHMRITFSSSSSPSSFNTEKGFKASFEVSELSSAAYSKEICYYGNINNERLSLNGTYGTLESPKEGSTYPPNMKCDWVITVPEGNIVKLSFDEFYLKPKYQSLCEDYVKVQDGKENYSESKGTFCGLSTPKDIRSSGRYMRVTFHSGSDSMQYRTGFKATFTAEEKETPGSSKIIVAITVGVVVFIVCICVVVCVAKYKQTRLNQSRAARIPMATQTTTSVSQTTQAGVIRHPPPPQQPAIQPPFQPASNPYPPPSVGFVPTAPNAYPPPPGYPYPLQPPPPYPGEEPVPQYPPPGQSYPWQQSSEVEPSAPPKEA